MSMSTNPRIENIHTDRHAGDGVSDTTIHTQTRPASDVVNYIGNLIGQLTSDVGNLVTLQLDLLKVEMRDSVKVVVRDSAMMIAGAIIGLLAFAILNLALIAWISTLLPMAPMPAFATAALIVGAVHLVLAGLLAFLGMRHLKKRSLKPERTMEEIQKDKMLMKEIRQ